MPQQSTVLSKQQVGDTQHQKVVEGEVEAKSTAK